MIRLCRVSLVFVLAALVVAACGRQPAAPAGAGPPPAVKVKLLQAFPVLDYAPIYIARGKGFFAAEGIDLEWGLVSGGATAAAALVSGDAHFAAAAGGDAILSQKQGLDMVAIAGVASGLTMSIAARQDWAKEKGVSKSSSLQDRVKALKGADFGVSAPGQAPHLYAAYLFRQYGLSDKDLNLVAVGGGPPRRAALQQKKVVAFIGGMPDAEQTEFEGYGMAYVSMYKEIPIFKDFAYEILAATPKYLKENPDVASKMAKAVARASNFLLDNLAEAKLILQTFFPDVNPKVISDSVDGNLGAFRRNARMDKVFWDNHGRVLLEVGQLDKLPDTSEGKFWTNQYLPK